MNVNLFNETLTTLTSTSEAKTAPLMSHLATSVIRPATCHHTQEKENESFVLVNAVASKIKR
jgi:hypothetical protein